MSNEPGAERLLQLADRIEASEPSRILDALLDIACGMSRPAWANDTGHLTVDGDCVRVSPEGAGWYPPPYTTSLDAAVGLVPEGCKWAIWHDGQARVRVSGSEEPDFVAPSWEVYDVATPAMALCSAALRARAASMKETTK